MCLLVTILREERLLSDSVIGAMTIAKLVHEEVKVMKSCVAVAEYSVLQQRLPLLTF